MNIEKEKRGSTLNISIEGALDVNTAPQLLEALEGELEDVEEVCFDLSKTTYSSSSGLRVFLILYNTMHKKNGRIVMKNVNKDLYNILRIGGFTGLMRIEKA